MAHQDPGGPPPIARFYDWECEQFLNDQRRDVRWYGRLAAATGGPVLELACGSGRVSVQLAEAGCDVVGLDLEPHLVDLASRRAEAAGVGHLTRFVVGDMKRFAAGRRFPLVLLPYNTLGYLLTDAEVAAAFGCIAAHLAPGGVFAFQVCPFEVRESPGPRGMVASGPFADGVLTMYEAISAEPERHITHYDEEYHLRRPGRPVQIFRQRLTLRSFYRSEVERLLAAAGFTTAAVHGDFDGHPYPIPHRTGGPILFEATSDAAT